jgi:hypothetical protein
MSEAIVWVVIDPDNDETPLIGVFDKWQAARANCRVGSEILKVTISSGMGEIALGGMLIALAGEATTAARIVSEHTALKAENAKLRKALTEIECQSTINDTAFIVSKALTQ